jgi:hypothetical protein
MSEFESYMDELALHRQPETFTFSRVGTRGCEIVGPEGVIAWTVDAAWAAIIVGLLNRVEGQDSCLSAAVHAAAETRPSVSRYP